MERVSLTDEGVFYQDPCMSCKGGDGSYGSVSPLGVVGRRRTPTQKTTGKSKVDGVNKS